MKGTPVYLRDLKIDLQVETENSIRKHRPDLVTKMDKGEDVTIGYYLREEDYTIE